MAENSPVDDDASPDLEGAAEPEIAPESCPEPDQAWKALGLVNDWIKHADAKVGATLAVTVLCAVAVVAAGGSAALALMPRLTIVSRWRSSPPAGSQAQRVLMLPWSRRRTR